MDRMNSAIIIKSFCPDGRVWNLSGQHNARLRQHLYGQLAGRSVTQSESGINNLMRLVYEKVGIVDSRDGQYYGCTAIRERFLFWLLSGI